MPELNESPKPDAPRMKKDLDAEPGTDPEMKMPVSKKDMKRAFRLNEVYTFVIAIVTAAVAVIVGYRVFISEAKAAGVEAAKELVKRVDVIEENQKEVRQDVRALYRAVMTKQPQPRLEKDPDEKKDGGP